MNNIPVEFKMKDRRIATIRKIAVSDAAAIIDFITQADTESTFLMREPGEFEMNVEQEERWIANAIDSDAFNLVAEVEGSIAANFQIAVGSRQRVRHFGTIGIIVLKEFWSLGIGRKLMELGIEWAEGRGLDKLKLEVDHTNIRAFSLYSSVGFVVEGTRHMARKLSDGTYRHDYLMAKFLK